MRKGKGVLRDLSIQSSGEEVLRDLFIPEQRGGHPVGFIHFRTAMMAFCEIYPFQSIGKVHCGVHLSSTGGRAFCEVYPFQNSDESVL